MAEALMILIEEIQNVEARLLLIFEDIQHISDNEINVVIERLLAYRPSNLQIILSSRSPLPFNQAKLIAQGLLTVIERPDIAFDLNETQAYLERNLELTLSQEQKSRASWR